MEFARDALSPRKINPGGVKSAGGKFSLVYKRLHKKPLTEESSDWDSINLPIENARILNCGAGGLSYER
jgi:hypothetical protein